MSALQTLRYALADGIATLTFDEPGSPVNTMCAQWQQDLTAAVQQLVKDKDAIRGIVLASAKSTFFAGADLKGTMRLKPEDAPLVFREIEQTYDVGIISGRRRFEEKESGTISTSFTPSSTSACITLVLRRRPGMLCSVWGAVSW